eukprot:SM000035S13150  [mRNA]  locus=s35:888154:888789:- [translate_table: standard]
MGRIGGPASVAARLPGPGGDEIPGAPRGGPPSKFFETFAGAFTKRGILLKLLVLGGAGALGYTSATAGGQLLPIKNGPQKAPTGGPRGKI